MDASLAPSGRFQYRLTAVSLAILMPLSCVGCTTFRKDAATVERNPAAGTTTQIVADLARPSGTNTIRVEGVSMVQGLRGTGGDPPPSAEREMLLEEMRVREVDQPNHVLASKNTALVTVVAYLPPGVQKGDPIDVEVRVPSRSNVDSLHGGWLMPTRLREYARLKNRVASGHVVGTAQGDVLIDALFSNGDDPVMRIRGRVLGGGIASTSRNLGLIVRDEHLSVATSAKIGEQINKRFHIYDRGLQRPVATPKRDRYIELLVHPRYQDNVVRYVRVIQSIPIRFGPTGVAGRLRTLESELINPSTSSMAALSLEALGQDGIPVLQAGLRQNDKEVAFYSAEALAYLDDAAAVQPLVAAIASEPAFRQRAFVALGAMDVSTAHEALVGLLHAKSAETRYAAFRTLRRIMPDDPAIHGERLGQFYYHPISSDSEPLVHATRAERPEIVLFGTDHALRLPISVYAGDSIVIRGDESGEITVTKFIAGQDDQSIKCPPQLDPVIRSIVDLGGSYPDVMQAITQAKASDSLSSRVEFAAIPTANRKYQREVAPDTDQASISRPVQSTLLPFEETLGEQAPASDEGESPEDRVAQQAKAVFPINPLRDGEHPAASNFTRIARTNSSLSQKLNERQNLTPIGQADDELPVAAPLPEPERRASADYGAELAGNTSFYDGVAASDRSYEPRVRSAPPLLFDVASAGKDLAKSPVIDKVSPKPAIAKGTNMVVLADSVGLSDDAPEPNDTEPNAQEPSHPVPNKTGSRDLNDFIADKSGEKIEATRQSLAIVSDTIEFGH